MEKIEEIAKQYFGTEVTARDRAIFEGAITLGAIFHQFTGIPIIKSLIPLLKETIEKTMAIQPFIKQINVKINDQSLRNYEHTYDYSVLSGNTLELEVISQYGDITVHLGMKYIAELDFPLMFIKKIEKK
ncbi:MAG TPA: dihydroneopterin aldolase family protein [Candidatus Deferrimicrobium sp.]|nr:dihydroneopterin aldolase family protein [Candidatus Deferrimicrobium sp.]